jgi:hypothetical protein
VVLRRRLFADFRIVAEDVLLTWRDDEDAADRDDALDVGQR